MIDLLLEPFGYGYMTTAMWVSALVGGVCAFLSSYLMLKGWSLIGDALSSFGRSGGCGGLSCWACPSRLVRSLPAVLQRGAMLFLSAAARA